jgi:hypothetical protein
MVEGWLHNQQISQLVHNPKRVSRLAKSDPNESTIIPIISKCVTKKEKIRKRDPTMTLDIKWEDINHAYKLRQGNIKE